MQKKLLLIRMSLLQSQFTRLMIQIISLMENFHYQVYAIHKNPDAAEEIKNKPLVKCIEQYITSDSITALAKRSAWIGNDETHYVRKHEELNFTDMKTFIEATQYFISMNLVVEKAASISPK